MNEGEKKVVQFIIEGNFNTFCKENNSMGKFEKKMANPERMTQEGAEGMKEMHVDAPNTRFQNVQQVNEAASANNLNTPDSSFKIKKSGAKGSQLKQEIAAEVVSGRGSGGRGGSSEIVGPATYGLKSLKYSGDTGTILGNASDTPIMQQSNQGASRVDKRLSDPNKDINYLASEQILVEYDNVAPLAGSESTVGYNGNPKNVAARVQKTNGGTSAELLFDRSLDYVADDSFAFVAGQVVKQKGVNYADYPTKTSWQGNSSQKDPVAFDQTRGNYSPREIDITFSVGDDGRAYVSSFEVQEDDFSANQETYDTVNRAGTNEKIFMNKSELARQRIDAKCGSPTQEHFNPLGRSVKQPTATVGYLRDVEATTGATLFAAYKFANKARAYYLTRTMKDGQDIEAPAIEALYGHLMDYTSRDDMMAQYKEQYAADKAKYPFICPSGLAAGSAAILLQIFDSPSKYKTKADLVTQPRGLKLHYQTADNNINPFRLEENFVATLNSIDVFSTIDRGYDPMSCICATDGVRLVYPYSWNKALKFTRTAAGEARVYDDQLFAYSYAAGNGLNQYLVKVADPILNAVAYFAEMHAQEIADALGATKTKAITWKIPTVHYGMHFGLWDLLLCACAPYVVYERTNAMKDVLDYEVNFEYPFDLTTIEKANPMNAVNYQNVDSMKPLISGTMVASSAIRWTMPEIMRPIGSDGMLMPFYFSEDQYAAEGANSSSLLLMETHGHGYTTPVIRAGVRLAYLDDFWAMDAKSSQLCYDRMVRLPIVSASDPTIGTKFKGVIYKYSQDAEGIPVVTDWSKVTATLADYLATPRQLGWFMPAPAGTCIRAASKNRAGNAATFAAPAVVASAVNIGTAGVAPSTRAIMYKGLDTTVREKQLGAGSVVVDRGQSFTQKWYYKWANGASAVLFDLPLSIADIMTKAGAVNAADKFTPFVFNNQSNDGTNVYDKDNIFSIHRVMWPIIQKTPFVISPFDCGADNGAFTDPFSLAYVFGLAGFMCADYEEEDYNRVSRVMNEGFGYTVDPFIHDSPVFKDAYSKTNI